MAAAIYSALADSGNRANSAGVYVGGLDPFVEAVMDEMDITFHDHEPKAMDDLVNEHFDAIIALTPEAAIAAQKHFTGAAIEYWETENPSEEQGGRDAIVNAYRRVRDELVKKIRDRFGEYLKKP